MDESDKEEFYTIGALSKIVKISKDTLRYYDEIGLVKPAYISEQTGYRYYSGSQIVFIARVLELKQYGFSLGKINEILSDDGLPQIDAYRERYFELIREQKELKEKIKNISLRINQIQEGMYMSKKILLVDDAVFMRMMCKDILSKAGYTVVGEAGNGKDAIEKFKELSPDMVLLDIVMPEMNGIQILKCIKEINNDVKVIMLSALGNPSMVAEALLAGAQNFVVKPFQAETLITTIYSTFNKEYMYANSEILHQILKKCGNSNDILSQNQINEIMESAEIGGNYTHNTDELINKITGGNHSEIMTESDVNNILNELVKGQKDSKESEIINILNELTKGQNEMKTLLTKILEK